jgi:hypothetical protein
LTTTLTPSLAKLAAEPATANARRLWRAISVEDRRLALETLLASDTRNAVMRMALRAEIAKARKFRPQVLAGWDDAKLADTAARIDLKEQAIGWDALSALHIHGRSAMLAQFLDSLGIKHTNGVFEEEPTEPISEAKLRAAADELLGSFDEPAVVLYLLALRASQPGFAGVDGKLKELAEATAQ